MLWQQFRSFCFIFKEKGQVVLDIYIFEVTLFLLVGVSYVTVEAQLIHLCFVIKVILQGCGNGLWHP